MVSDVAQSSLSGGGIPGGWTRERDTEELVAVNPCDVAGEIFHLVHVWTRPVAVNGVVEQRQPAFKMGDSEGFHVMDAAMGSERIAGVSRSAEQCSTPEGSQLRHVFGPIHLSDLVKYGTQQVIPRHLRIKLVHEGGHVMCVIEITSAPHCLVRVHIPQTTPERRIFLYFDVYNRR